jgi:transcriptional regulator with XRE-family HTH domain
MAFGEWLEQELSARNLSLTAFARDVGVSPGTVSRWIHGQRRPDYALSERIAWVLDYDPQVVLVQTGHQPFPETRRKQLQLEYDRAWNQAMMIDAELENLRHKRDELTDRIEQIRTELDRLEAAHERDHYRDALEAIDQLPLSDMIKDRIRNVVLDAMKAEEAAKEESGETAPTVSARE